MPEQQLAPGDPGVDRASTKAETGCSGVIAAAMPCGEVVGLRWWRYALCDRELEPAQPRGTEADVERKIEDAPAKIDAESRSSPPPTTRR